jgi:hypothetical protein
MKFFSAHKFHFFSKLSEHKDAPLSGRRPLWPGCVPLVGLSLLVLLCAPRQPAWIFMWTLAFALFAACKWLTWWEAGARGSRGRQVAYLFFWPGMDARNFLDATRRPVPPSCAEWSQAVIKVLLGGLLLSVVARLVPVRFSLTQIWIANLGLALVLHLGSFHLLSLFWRGRAIDAPPLMDRPLLARSLGNFWGERWNRGFHVLMARFFFVPLRPYLGLVGATGVAFLVSGLIHDLVISVPAGGGYGRPTMYFLLQCGGVLAERSRLGRRLGLRRGFRGWAFTMLVVAGPVGLLFPPGFLEGVMRPFYEALGVL